MEVIKCDSCSYTTNTVANLKRHMIRHQDIYKYCCAICGQQFKCSTSLYLHQYTHRENSFECPHCQKKFSRPQGLKNHIDSVHLQKKHFCPECNEPFASYTGMMKHFRVLHQGIRLVCLCGKMFDRPTRYKKHGEVCDLAAANPPEMRSIYENLDSSPVKAVILKTETVSPEVITS